MSRGLLKIGLLIFKQFGPDIKRWIKTVYKNANMCVSLNGQYTSWFDIQRGVKGSMSTILVSNLR